MVDQCSATELPPQPCYVFPHQVSPEQSTVPAHGRTLPCLLSDQMTKPHFSCDLFFLINLKSLIALASLLNVTFISSALPLKPGVPRHTETLATALAFSLLLLVLQSCFNWFIHWKVRRPHQQFLDKDLIVFIGPHKRWENLIQRCLWVLPV